MSTPGGDTALPPPALIPVDAALDTAAAALPVGGLLHGPTFSLHDAMLAVEVGDPKLDAGARSKEEEGEAGEEGAPDAGRALTPSAAAAALDDLAAQEAAWHAGGSLRTTLLTHAWMLYPERCGVERQEGERPRAGSAATPSEPTSRAHTGPRPLCSPTRPQRPPSRPRKRCGAS